MTLLNYQIEPGRVIILTDTLSLDASSKAPRSFVTKIFLLPHLDMVLCGTGVMNFVLGWYLQLQSGVLASDVDTVDGVAPSLLSSLFDQYVEAAGDLNCPTSTIYHFGFSHKRGRFAAYAYRSTNDFASEEKQSEEIGIKPAVSQTTYEACSDPLTECVALQKAADDEKEQLDRVGIGGELIACVMTRDTNSETGLPITMGITKMQEFSDRGSHYSTMLANCAAPF